MGGGTWIYLGHFYFNKGRQTVVTLENKSSDRKSVVTADAVKIGGGFGNIARKRSDNFDAAARGNDGEVKLPSIKSEYAVSGYPRFTEGARYWLQWAGMPDSVYSPSKGANDYTDDYRCRGVWVNYLAGGSDVLPNYKGLNIPVDMSFAFHSDAGTTMNDSIIGTLGIYFTNKVSAAKLEIPKSSINVARSCNFMPEQFIEHLEASDKLTVSYLRDIEPIDMKYADRKQWHPQFESLMKTNPLRSNAASKIEYDARLVCGVSNLIKQLGFKQINMSFVPDRVGFMSAFEVRSSIEFIIMPVAR